jgi:hypothetical protein
MQIATNRKDLELNAEMPDEPSKGMSMRQCMVLTSVAAGGAAVGLGLIYYYMRKRRESR